MDSQDVKKYLAGFCMATLLAGANIAAPGPAVGSSSCSGCGKTEDSRSGGEKGHNKAKSGNAHNATDARSGGSCEGSGSCEGKSGCA